LLAPPPLADAEHSEEDLERQCNQLFHEAPIKFKCRPGNKFDETILRLITKCKVTIPIIHVRAGIYFVGATKVNLEQKFQQVNVRVGGGQERFDVYVPKNHHKFERTLVRNMNISQLPLQTVVDHMI